MPPASLSESALTAFAFAYASRFHLAEVKGWFAGDPEVRDAKTHLVARWADGGAAYAFNFGALVFLRVPAKTREATLEAAWRSLRNEPHPPLREELIVEMGEGEQVEVGFDRVRVPVISAPVLHVIATVVAQSACLDYYDEDVQDGLDRIHRIASKIAQSGKPPGKHDEIVKLAGASVASQVEVMSSLALLDKPALTWDDPLADELYDKLRAVFEIDVRYRALDAKLRATREGVGAFLDVAQSRRSHLLEAMVILLILVEIVMSLLKIQ